LELNAELLKKTPLGGMIMPRCPDCNSPVRRRERFCPRCGKRIIKLPEDLDRREVFRSPTMAAGGIALLVLFLIILILRFLG